MRKQVKMHGLTVSNFLSLHHIPFLLLVSFLATFFAGFIFAFLKRYDGRPFLNRTQQVLQVQDKVALNHNTIRLRLALPDSTFVLGLPIGKHIKVYAPNAQGVIPGKWNNKPDPSYIGLLATNPALGGLVERKYTPITGDDCRGFTDLVVKIYRRGEHESYPDGGKVSQYLDSLKIGDTLTVCGPVGAFTYHGSGIFSHGSTVLPRKKNILFIAGGTGITPFFQIIKAILNDSRDTTRMFLLYANRTEEDILLRTQLEEYSIQYPKRLFLWYTIDRPIQPQKWSYSVGYVNNDIIKEHFPQYNPDFVALLCGPPGFVHQAAKTSLLSLEWPESDILVF